MARADDDARVAYEDELRQIIDAASAGLQGDSEADRRAEAIALLALLAGGVSLARAVKDPALAEEITAAVHRAATALEAPARPAKDHSRAAVRNTAHRPP